MHLLCVPLQLYAGTAANARILASVARNYLPFAVINVARCAVRGSSCSGTRGMDWKRISHSYIYGGQVISVITFISVQMTPQRPSSTEAARARGRRVSENLSLV